MSADWPLVSIDEIKADSKGSIAIGPFGSRMKSDCYVDEGIPVIRGTNITSGPTFEGNFVYITKEKSETLGSSNVYQYDLVFPHRGSIGEVGIILDDEHFVLSSSLMKLTCDLERVNPKFIYYFFKSRLGRHELLKNASQVGTPGIGQPLASLKSIELRLPPLEVQNRIEEMLTSLDEKIELNRQTNQTLEQISQAIFKSWFVDFEPVRAKIAAKQNGRDPERAAMAAISGKSLDELDQLSPEQQEQLKATADLFPDALVDSGLGEIPEGWNWSEIGNEVAVVGGGTPSTKKEEFWEGGHIHWTSPKDMSNLTDKIILETGRKITEAGLAKISSGLLPVDTVLMSSRAPVGYLAISKIPVAINQGYIAMKCEGQLTPEYVVQWAESVMDEIKQRASGTTFAEISKKNFKIIPIIVPNNDVISEFSKVVSSLYGKITEGLCETKSLTETRDSLLPKLLSGELELTG